MMRASRYIPYSVRLVGARFLLLTFVLVAGTSISRAYRAYAQLPVRLSENARVSLLTIYPSAPIYSAFAHSALRFRDDSTGVDVVFNYGTFDDRDPFFLPKFIYGRMDYSLSANWTEDVLAGWEEIGRSVVEQTFHLPTASTALLYDRVRDNYRPENRVYRYDFLFQNCATILLDLLHETEGFDLRIDSTHVRPESFRQLLEPYIAGRPFYDAGIALAMGASVDRVATYEERSFLPLELLELVEHATVAGPDGLASLEASRDTLVWVGPGFSETFSYPWLAVILWILVVGWIGLVTFRSGPVGTSPRGDRILFGILGVIGVVLMLLWFATAHHVTASNWNVLWAFPAHIWPAFFWKKMKAESIRRYFLVVLAVLLLLTVAQLFAPQSLHPVFVPVVLAAAWRSFVLVTRKTSTS